MTTVDPVFAQWLQAAALYHLESDETLSARWGARTQSSERITPLALQPDAEAEALRQLAFLGGPLVEDEHLLVGTWADRLGQVISIESEQLGDQAVTVTLGGEILTLGGADVTLGGPALCFVIGAQDDRATDLSRVSVLRRL